jgi:hypothetical protein
MAIAVSQKAALSVVSRSRTLISVALLAADRRAFAG